MPVETKFESDKVFLAGLESFRRDAFLAWFAELNLANKNGLAFYAGQPLEEATGIECWFSFFEDGCTPQEALDEDLANGD